MNVTEAEAAVVSHQVIVNLIAATTTNTGLKVRAKLVKNIEPKGRKVTAAELAIIYIRRHSIHGEWNDTILPAGK